MSFACRRAATPCRPSRLLAASALGLALAAAALGACGRSELRVGRAPAGAGLDAAPDGLEPADAGGDGPEDVAADSPPDAVPDAVVEDCLDAGITYIYLVTSQNELLAFYPPSASTMPRGYLACPAGEATPFSMGVSRHGTAYVVFTDGNLYRVSTADASCQPTGFEVGQYGFVTFGMGFAADDEGPGETLYVAEITFQQPSLGLAWIDTQSFELTYIGPFSQNPGNAIELTPAGDGPLFGYFLDTPGPGGHVVEIDKKTAAILSSTSLAVGDDSSALAFAFWGGDFYIFTTQGSEATTITRYRPSDGSIVVVATYPGTVVGAGVSTCAPTK